MLGGETAMICNNNVCNEFGAECAGNGFGVGFDCIINLIIILIVLQFLSGIICGNGLGSACY
jgi:hypothetical protein